MSNLQELTGHESGLIVYGDEILALNWVGVNGLPRIFATGIIGLGEEFTLSPCATPDYMVEAANAHEEELGSAPSRDGFTSWKVIMADSENDDGIIVTVQEDWA